MSRSPAGPSRSHAKTSPAKLVVRVVAVVLLGALVYGYNHYRYVKQYNRIVEELVNQGKHDEAVRELETFVRHAPAKLVPEGKKQLAQSYLTLGDRPELPLVKSAEYFRKAESHDPAALQDHHRQAIRAAAAVPSIAEEESADEPPTPTTDPATK